MLLISVKKSHIFSREITEKIKIPTTSPLAARDQRKLKNGFHLDLESLYLRFKVLLNPRLWLALFLAWSGQVMKLPEISQLRLKTVEKLQTNNAKANWDMDRQNWRRFTRISLSKLAKQWLYLYQIYVNLRKRVIFDDRNHPSWRLFEV